MIKKMLTVMIAAWMLLSLAVPALAEEGPVIRVSGNATVSLTADTATLQIGVNIRKDTVSEAQQENAEIMQAVIAAIQQTGIEEKDVITSSFNVFSGYDTSYSSLGAETRRNYYQVENMLCVTVRDLDMVGAVLDAAMAAGANTTYGISFSSTQENEAYQKALTRAYEDAEKKAGVLCAAAGKTLGDLRVIDASQGNYGYGMRNTYAYDAAKGVEEASTAILSGDVSVSASVMVEFAVK